MTVQHVCPICDAAVNGDDAYFEYHVGVCLDAETRSPKRRRIMPPSADDVACCPLCHKAFQAELKAINEGEQQTHVDLCLEAQGGDRSPIRLIPEHASPDEAKCPHCLIGLTSALGRAAHEDDCSLRHELLDGNIEEEHGGGSPSHPASLNGSKTSTAVRGHQGIIEILAQLLQSLVSKGSTRSACLCVPTVRYINGQLSDLGWGCGYRNMQMLLSAARSSPAYREILGSAVSSNASNLPTIEELQMLIERGWASGFDPDGGAHFNGKLRGRRKWIGTTEVYVALSMLGVRAQIYDFPKGQGPQGAHHGLTKWIRSYFTDTLDQARNPFELMSRPHNESVRPGHRLPVFLQHAGHSRTVVGLETTHNGDLHLLVFDPAKACPSKVRRAASTDSPEMISIALRSNALSSLNPRAPLTLDDATNVLEPFRVSLKSLSRHKEYQILTVDSGPRLTEEEKSARKIIKSTVIKG